jgi:hypothetical protein
MRMAALAVVSVLSAALVGCFTADRPLLTDANSVAPYRIISVREEHSAEVRTLTRNGNAYAMVTTGGPVAVRFMALDRSDWYVVQASGTPLAEGAPGLFYAVVRIDLAAHRAYAFKSIGNALDVTLGLHACGAAICIDDLAAYAAGAEVFADANRAADVTYEIDVE